MLTFNEESIVYSENGSGNNHGLMHRCLRTGPTPPPLSRPPGLNSVFSLNYPFNDIFIT